MAYYERTKPKGLSPKAWARHKACTSKKSFKHRGKARSEAHKRGQRAYQCDYCGEYHLTSKPDTRGPHDHPTDVNPR